MSNFKSIAQGKGEAHCRGFSAEKRRLREEVSLLVEADSEVEYHAAWLTECIEVDLPGFNLQKSFWKEEASYNG